MNKVSSFIFFIGLVSCPALGQASQQPAKASGDVAFQAEVHRLLLLSLQLQANLEKTKRFELSVPVVQQAAQIETLAKTLRTQSQPR
jgi:hypothetical protein